MFVYRWGDETDARIGRGKGKAKKGVLAGGEGGKVYLTQDPQSVQETQQMEIRRHPYTLLRILAPHTQLLGHGAELLTLADDVAVLDREMRGIEQGVRLGRDTIRERHEQILDRETWLRILLHARPILIDPSIEDLGYVPRPARRTIVFLLRADEHNGGISGRLDDIGTDHFDGGIGGLEGGDGDTAVLVATEDAGNEVGAEAAGVAPFGRFGVLGLETGGEGDFEGGEEVRVNVALADDGAVARAGVYQIGEDDPDFLETAEPCDLVHVFFVFPFL